MVKYDNIPGFPGYYISKRGGLWSNRKNGQWKKLKPHLNKMWNRYQCTLRDSRGIRKLCKISRLVATVYLPKPSSTKLVIRHLDDNPLNNHVDNLRWGTQKQNMEDARKNGKLRGSSCKASRAKLSKKDLILIFKLKAKGLYYKDLAKRLGVSVGTIGRVINKKSYRDENIDRKR